MKFLDGLADDTKKNLLEQLRVFRPALPHSATRTPVLIVFALKCEESWRESLALVAHAQALQQNRNKKRENSLLHRNL